MAGNEEGSGPRQPSEEIIFHYSREHRLERASQAVRDLNNSASSKRSLVKTIAGSRGNLLMLLSIVIVCIAMLFGSRMKGRQTMGFELGENTVSMAVRKSGDGLALFMEKKAPKDGNGYTGAVGIVISPQAAKPSTGGTSEPPPMLTHLVFFSLAEEENYSIDLPFGGTDFIVVVQTDNERLSRRLKVK
ncbi:hypothetical protein [Leadbettera azotonutricia]|uniref:Uncharacterized protein n=1 Tax=Leadbettera azotonutricia (strain ATCC BAA-888 / DSM 13862 / ZAS-9) TaxID=545695 RepID=F5YAY6_LEAAZ|nr:hypothetical protein [Leadbettera azotonutricia]AEF81231.1 hypothetical protein TREAZ_0643 [Leadbettera azotonutricia ZAS-9]